jgi:hypothetical protein
MATTFVYPGRLYVHEFPAFGAIVQRLVYPTQDELVAHILGWHIEESRNPVVRLSDWNKPAPFGMLSATSPSGPFPAMGLACG